MSKCLFKDAFMDVLGAAGHAVNTTLILSPCKAVLPNVLVPLLHIQQTWSRFVVLSHVFEFKSNIHCFSSLDAKCSTLDEFRF